MTAHTLTIALDDPLAAEVRLAAQARGLTPDEYVRTSLKEDLEFQADRNEIESRMTRFFGDRPCR